MHFLLDARGAGSWDKQNLPKAKFFDSSLSKLVATKKTLGPPA
jgi:hypothetical protein